MGRMEQKVKNRRRKENIQRTRERKVDLMRRYIAEHGEDPDVQDLIAKYKKILKI